MASIAGIDDGSLKSGYQKTFLRGGEAGPLGIDLGHRRAPSETSVPDRQSNPSSEEGNSYFEKRSEGKLELKLWE
jgi:hypothetical protein